MTFQVVIASLRSEVSLLRSMQIQRAGFPASLGIAEYEQKREREQTRERRIEVRATNGCPTSATTLAKKRQLTAALQKVVALRSD